jgi:hypothetical protein
MRRACLRSKCGVRHRCMRIPSGAHVTALLKGEPNEDHCIAGYIDCHLGHCRDTGAGGNIQVTTNSSTIADDVALLEYAVTSSHVTVSDGVDSFVIDNGLIVAQTAHLGGLAIQ